MGTPAFCLPFDDLAQRFPKLAAWERGEQSPTFKQLESYAQATHTAIGFFFLPEPPEAAQIFTLLHELAHLWLGGAALDDANLATAVDNTDVERWCNQVAAEVLVPISSVPRTLPPGETLTAALERLARKFKVSTLVVLRRLHDAGVLDWAEYRAAHEDELSRVMAILGERAAGGGNFFNTQPARVSRRFARAVVTSTLEGQTLYRDALQLLGFKKVSTLKRGPLPNLRCSCP